MLNHNPLTLSPKPSTLNPQPQNFAGGWASLLPNVSQRFSATGVMPAAETVAGLGFGVGFRVQEGMFRDDRV